jgi:hypothetical protein
MWRSEPCLARHLSWRAMLVLSALMLILLAAACSDDDPTSPGTSSDLVGVVLAPDGTPAAGAGIVLEYEPPPLNRPSTEIRFSVPEEGRLTLWVSGQCYPDTLAVLIDEVVGAGVHAVAWDGWTDDDRRVPDGLYTVHARFGEEIDTREIMLFLAGDYPSEANPWDWLVLDMTSATGSFSLPQACLPLGHTCTMPAESGESGVEYTIPYRVRFHAMHRTYRTAVSDWVEVDPETGCTVTLRFTP